MYILYEGSMKILKKHAAECAGELLERINPDNLLDVQKVQKVFRNLIYQAGYDRDMKEFGVGLCQWEDDGSYEVHAELRTGSQVYVRFLVEIKAPVMKSIVTVIPGDGTTGINFRTGTLDQLLKMVISSLVRSSS